MKTRARTTSTPGCSQRHIYLNWSNFKPEYSGKPEEDADAHLLCWNDWMEAHHFNEDIKSTEVLPHTTGRSKIMVPIYRTFGRDYMGTITKFI